ncbi:MULTISPECIES: hypothetical protein [Paenibacillus]|uniref:hypothetical protein n=1 Tax=Paenibacillus TaxID=44249 RepID=UPI0022B8A4D8|nr:hypothetical protein [Paenibacillus caseinilyticus]MCZ8521531.1 hypothetical protein [Paenibacillus caseinilyticus]
MSNQGTPSWTGSRQVPGEELQARLETIRTLQDNGLEMYEIAKDSETGEHYLHYSYLHRNLAGAPGAGAGGEEVFHHLLPLGSDDVLGILFSKQPYTYPDHWTRAFLRNGPEGQYVWFDPAYAAAEAENEAFGQDLASRLAAFKQQGNVSEEAVRRFLEELEKGPGDSK